MSEIDRVLNGVYEVPGDRLRELRQASAERDRYRDRTPELIERLASAAFEWDRLHGHHKGGPWTWHMIGEEGQANYRAMVSAVLAELDAVALEGSRHPEGA